MTLRSAAKFFSVRCSTLQVRHFPIAPDIDRNHLKFCWVLSTNVLSEKFTFSNLAQ